MTTPHLPATRRQFIGPRLALTALLLALLLATTRFLWYPGLTFNLSGVSYLILIISGFALLVGPGLSTLVYRPGKKGLRGDLISLMVVELLAIGLAANALYERRPYFAVFAVDRFELVAAGEVSWDDIRYEQLLDKPGYTPRLVLAQLPDDPEVHSALIDEVLFDGLPDIDRRPEFWRPYSSGIDSIIERAIPLENLLEADATAARRVQRWLAYQPGDISDYAYLPVRGKAKDGAMVMHREIGYPIAMLNVDPWQSD